MTKFFEIGGEMAYLATLTRGTARTRQNFPKPNRAERG